jgi:hypothetical protein
MPAVELFERTAERVLQEMLDTRGFPGWVARCSCVPLTDKATIRFEMVGREPWVENAIDRECLDPGGLGMLDEAALGHVFQAFAKRARG